MKMKLSELPGLEELVTLNPKLKKLVEKHTKLDQLVSELNQRFFLTAEEEKKLKILKFKRLKIKEEIINLYNRLKPNFNFEFNYSTVGAVVVN